MYHYPKNAGQGVDIYVVDTGVNIEHKEFKRDDGSSRARWGATMPSGDANVDGNGHGSHVAGTAAGKTYGLAKAANVIAVKVLRSDGSGTLSDVIRGLEWVIRDHRSKQTDTANSEDSQDSNDNTDSVSMLIRKLRNKIKSKQDKKKRNKLSVANMSLGGGQSRALDQAVNKAVEAGVHFAVAAGNERSDACRSSPAGAEKPITVGASTSSDRMAMFSNLGSCVDIVAPGQDIKSIWNTRDGVNTISGTSMASPHVAGALAVYLSDGKEYASTQNLKEALISVATEDALINIPRGTVNKLLFVDTSAI
jgi:cerevisin